MKLIRNLASDESGATAIEYGLLVALIAIAAIASLQAVGNELSTTMNKIGTTMSNGNTAA
ncbi:MULTISPECIES: Flp family type IVb pilin [Qipengyuania]|uniref:Flp family type IVb pilin n=1 Tax=Qipengyuania soli TaxID=2782568 RepID=A0A7S8F4A6_9SPHN|nr:Flp family type IVb pilin [Qipengyuania soli]QPD00206.1 Flp family type IVb pilin [Qipengyuania soli]